ncbi:MAG: hypothetical protein Fur0023_10670 [Bacteroidia bacterium]
MMKKTTPHTNRIISVLTTFFFLFTNDSYTFSQSIRFFPDTIFACKTDSIKLSIPSEILSKSLNIQWITPYSIIYHSSTLNVYQEGKYILKLKTKNTEISDSVIIVKSDIPVFNINDTILCNGKTITIPLNHPFYQFYLPNSKQSVRQLNITHSGKYTVKIANKGCVITKQFDVKPVNPTVPEHTEYTFCIGDENKKISVKHNGISKILWSNGSTQSTINADKEGEYWIKISDKYCGTKTDTIVVKFKPCNCEILIPNTFTPNDDGKNDFFAPILSCDYSYYNLTIYDKWNNIVFSTTNPNAKWDGRYKGNPLPEDVYVYKLETIEKNSDKKNSRTGKITLIR